MNLLDYDCQLKSTYEKLKSLNYIFNLKKFTSKIKIEINLLKMQENYILY